MRQVVLLRGINVGSRNRVSMPHLRDALERAGYSQVSTYLQSGNVVLSSDASPTEVGERCERLVADTYGIEVGVVVRTEPELRAVLALNPLAELAVDPKRYQVSFLSDEPNPEVLRALAGLAVAPERFIAAGREIYAWHPHGIAGSKLSLRLGSPGGGLISTARNWSTVTKLHALACD